MFAFDYYLFNLIDRECSLMVGPRRRREQCVSIAEPLAFHFSAPIDRLVQGPGPLSLACWLSDILIWLHVQLLHPTLKRCGVPHLCMIVMWVLAVLCC